MRFCRWMVRTQEVYAAAGARIAASTVPAAGCHAQLAPAGSQARSTCSTLCLDLLSQIGVSAFQARAPVPAFGAGSSSGGASGSGSGSGSGKSAAREAKSDTVVPAAAAGPAATAAAASGSGGAGGAPPPKRNAQQFAVDLFFRKVTLFLACSVPYCSRVWCLCCGKGAVAGGGSHRSALRRVAPRCSLALRRTVLAH